MTVYLSGAHRHLLCYPHSSLILSNLPLDLFIANTEPHSNSGLIVVLGFWSLSDQEMNGLHNALFFLLSSDHTGDAFLCPFL